LLKGNRGSNEASSTMRLTFSSGEVSSENHEMKRYHKNIKGTKKMKRYHKNIKDTKKMKRYHENIKDTKKMKRYNKI
jgi:hypothetical protein